MRAIDADALYTTITSRFDYCEDILEVVEAQPTIEPRADGEWRMVYHNARHTLAHIECDQCGYRTKNHAKYNFCTNCGSYNGADMRHSEGLE